jgi:transcription initiation factor IIE alpha subunit
MRVAHCVREGGAFYDQELREKTNLHPNSYRAALKQLDELGAIQVTPAKRGRTPQRRIFTIDATCWIWDAISEVE